MFQCEKTFEVRKQCKSDFQAKIHEALLMKKNRPSLNKQLYAHGLYFLIYKWQWPLLINLLFFPHEFLYFLLIDELFTC